MAYAPDVVAMFRRAAEYVDKILKGANPGDLPIEQPSRYMFVLNMKAAEAIGLTLPASLQLRADEVIK
jgi:putative ABC transport system substrate-binding protein